MLMLQVWCAWDEGGLQDGCTRLLSASFEEGGNHGDLCGIFMCGLVNRMQSLVNDTANRRGEFRCSGEPTHSITWFQRKTPSMEAMIIPSRTIHMLSSEKRASSIDAGAQSHNGSFQKEPAASRLQQKSAAEALLAALAT